MTRSLRIGVLTAVCILIATSESNARGFGGFRAGGFSGGGGFRAGGFSNFHAGGYGYGGAREVGGYRGFDNAGYRGSYDHSWSGRYGGSVNLSGERGAVRGPWGGAAVGGTRDVSVEGPGGRSYSSESQRGAAVGPWGNSVAGGSRVAEGTGRYGSYETAGRWGAAATRFPSDLGLARYSAVGVGGMAHQTYAWTRSNMVARAGYVRAGFVHYNGFTAGWYAGHPVAWYPAAWSVNSAAAWTYVGWSVLTSLWNYSAQPVYYDYGNTIVYQDNNVYVNGENQATAEQYTLQATAIADSGRDVQPPASAQWQALGVFALVQGDEKTSNNIFQLAVDESGTIRGNYCDAIMDTTTPVYGSVDKKTQRAAWTAGDNKQTVFETGVYNLTKDETPILVHMGKKKTQQWMLVRLKKPEDTK